jgi:type IV pilus assembly protein PilW
VSPVERSAGYTLIELLVSLTVVMAVLAIAMTFALASRKMYEADHARTDLNQNLRAAMEILAADMRQAGERLGPRFPALEIIDGDGGPDQLILRRNQHDTVLLVCEDLSPGDATIKIGGTSVDGCAPVPDDDGDGWNENLDRWRDERLAAGGQIVAYVYDPITGSGEFFDYEGENAADLTIRAGSSSWDRTYLADDHCQIYLLEEHRYEIADGLLQFVENGDTAQPRRIVDDVLDLRLVAHFQDGSHAPSLGFGDEWRDLRAIEVEIAGSTLVRGRPLDRRWSSEILPRNVLSR